MMPAEPVSAVTTDAALIAAWQGGDERAATELVHRHARALARFLAGAGAFDTEIDDLIQETFIRAFRRVDQFRGQCQFRTWLLTIGGNALKDAGRRARRARLVPLDEGLRSAGGDPHEVTVAAETEQRLVDGLSQLPRMQREVLCCGRNKGWNTTTSPLHSARRPGQRAFTTTTPSSA
jgi:RNA polymerase sigma-70 factor (ECF subfamily)